MSTKPKDIAVDDVVALLELTKGYNSALKAWMKGATKEQKNLYDAISHQSDKKLLNVLGPHTERYQVSGVDIDEPLRGMSLQDHIESVGVFYDLSLENDRDFFARYGDVFRYPMDITGASPSRLEQMFIFGQVVPVLEDFVQGFSKVNWPDGKAVRAEPKEKLPEILNFPDFTRTERAHTLRDVLKIVAIRNPHAEEDHPLYLLINQDFNEKYTANQVAARVLNFVKSERSVYTIYKGLNKGRRWGDIRSDIEISEKVAKLAKSEPKRKKIGREQKRIKELASIFER